MVDFGMPRFDAVLTPEQSGEIKAYVLHQAMDQWELEQAGTRSLSVQKWLAEKLAIVLVWLAG